MLDFETDTTVILPLTVARFHVSFELRHGFFFKLILSACIFGKSMFLTIRHRPHGFHVLCT